jgi:putative transposase
MTSAEGDRRRLLLVEQVLRLPEARLTEVEEFLKSLSPSGPVADGPPSRMPASCDWPHAPLHRLSEQGTYLVTAGTYQKEHHFRGPERLDYLEAKLLALANEAGWQLEAWAVFSNHYHFVAHARPDCEQLADWLAELHRQAATHVNLLDQAPGRQVWYN